MAILAIARFRGICCKRLRVRMSMRRRLRGCAIDCNLLVIVRVGADGAWSAIPGDEVLRIPGFPMKAVDTNGAGDCHAGVLCALLCEGVPLEEAVRCANAASALSVTRSGPATCLIERRLSGS